MVNGNPSRSVCTSPRMRDCSAARTSPKLLLRLVQTVAHATTDPDARLERQGILSDHQNYSDQEQNLIDKTCLVVITLWPNIPDQSGNY